MPVCIVFLIRTHRYPLKYYDLPASPYARRIHILMAEKGLDIPTEIVDMMKGENQVLEYRAKNPLGRMPLLALDDERYLVELGVNCRYLDNLHPEPLLFGRDAEERALVEMWHRRMGIEILMPMIFIFVHGHLMWKGHLPQVPEWGEINRSKSAVKRARFERVSSRPTAWA